ncbi:hypothetical protein [Clavibacter michiganensis]|uniref:hypothetical protein n=1 Tax=Clavibacter michiganensis TaxID=28447 RepID=UPI001FB5623C|nr:hypothetical protein [Clavibacter michiganensis]
MTSSTAPSARRSGRRPRPSVNAAGSGWSDVPKRVGAFQVPGAAAAGADPDPGAPSGPGAVPVAPPPPPEPDPGAGAACVPSGELVASGVGLAGGVVAPGVGEEAGVATVTSTSAASVLMLPSGSVTVAVIPSGPGGSVPVVHDQRPPATCAWHAASP